MTGVHVKMTEIGGEGEGVIKNPQTIYDVIYGRPHNEFLYTFHILVSCNNYQKCQCCSLYVQNLLYVANNKNLIYDYFNSYTQIM